MNTISKPGIYTKNLEQAKYHIHENIFTITVDAAVCDEAQIKYKPIIYIFSPYWFVNYIQNIQHVT